MLKISQLYLSDKLRVQVPTQQTNVAHSLARTDSMLTNIFWGEELERRIPNGISATVADTWIRNSRNPLNKIKSMERANGTKCGNNWRENAFAVLADGSQMCVR